MNQVNERNGMKPVKCRPAVTRGGVLLMQGLMAGLTTALLAGFAPARADAAPGGFCPEPLAIPARPAVEAALEPDQTFISADEADLVEDGASTLVGNVEVARNRQQARADKVIYDQPRDTADLEGNVNYWDDTLYLNSETAFLDFNTEVSQFRRGDYLLIERRGRGAANSMTHAVDTRTEMEDARYTTCDPDAEFWRINARSVDLDHGEEWGSARHVVVRIKSIPVFYTPYISFPLSDARKSGFLVPSYGNTTRHGFEFSTPYYWNIRPEMDATLTPRFLTESGVMAMGEYRYLRESGDGIVNAEYLPSDSQRGGRHRNLFGLKLNQRFLAAGHLHIDYNRVSDRFYFEDFGNQLSVSSTRFLEQRADIGYSGSNWNALLRVQNYQTVDRSIARASRPYKRLPQVLFNYNAPRRYGALNYGLAGEAVYFDRGADRAARNNINGLRLNLKPYISYPLRTVATFLEPRLGLDYAQYSLSDSSTFKNSPGRVLPVFSLDGGVFLEREASLFSRPYLQTLEPRLYYLYVPEENQSDLPVFDTGVLSNSFSALFRDNRFTGADRLGDANQLTLAVSSSLINQESGRDLGRVSLGQTLYFRDRKVTLPGAAIRDSGSSALIAALNTRIFDGWNLGADIIWDPHTRKGTRRFTAEASYNPAPGKILNLAYRVRREGADIEQSDISVRWPLSHKWSAVGRWNYSVPEGRSLEMFAGLEYEDCCWGARAVARRFLTNLEGRYETGFFLQLELKGLAGLGGNTLDFLKRQISGYRSEY